MTRIVWEHVFYIIVEGMIGRNTLQYVVQSFACWDVKIGIITEKTRDVVFFGECEIITDPAIFCGMEMSAHLQIEIAGKLILEAFYSRVEISGAGRAPY